MSAIVTNIREMLDVAGEEAVRDYVSQFSCERMIDGVSVSLNPDIEHFIKCTAIPFAQQKVSISYIVSDSEDGAFLGYFTITHKPIEIQGAGLSNTKKRAMRKYSDYDEEANTYTPSAFLIAQFGKNYGVDEGKRISGKELMGYVHDALLRIQNLAGGGICYLDCEAHAELIKFYEDEGFTLFGERISEADGKRYLQYLKFI